MVGPQHHWCLPSAPHVRGVRTKCAEPQHQTYKALLPSSNIRISSPLNTQQLSPSITFHHQPTSKNYHPPSHFITNQHLTTITQHNISSPTNIQQRSPNITFHHHPSPNNYHPTSHFITTQHPLSNTQHLTASIKVCGFFKLSVPLQDKTINR